MVFTQNLPKHVAIIPDGNRRWAKAKGLATFMGHRRGFDAAVRIGRTARELGIHTLTLWGFSTENWKRTQAEIDYLFKLFIGMTDRYLKEAHRDQVKIIHLGRKDRLPSKLVAKIRQAESETQHYRKHVLNLGVDYGGRDEIVRAITKIVSKPPKQKISEDLMSQYLDTTDQPYPYPDLIIRTSGEHRLSGFLLWQSAYSELYFEEKHFPDFTPARFKKAVVAYQSRQRRFGGN